MYYMHVLSIYRNPPEVISRLISKMDSTEWFMCLIAQCVRQLVMVAVVVIIDKWYTSDDEYIMMTFFWRYNLFTICRHMVNRLYLQKNVIMIYSSSLVYHLSIITTTATITNCLTHWAIKHINHSVLSIFEIKRDITSGGFRYIDKTCM